jgi:Leucine-rich repeat (LRR) protein
MVEALIRNVRAAEQSVIVYWRKLKPYYAGHEEAPLWMACLAAFPIAITVDLLYQLWANFRLLKDKDGNEYQLPPLVVNDCILSSLFTITGKDLYEMPSDTRAFLLNVLKQRFGDEIMIDLASFLFKYVREKRTGDFPGNFYEAQEWTALLTVDPQQAAMNILNTLKDKLDEEDHQESIGVVNLISALVKDNNDLAETMRLALDKKKEPDHEGIGVLSDYIEPYYRSRKNIHIKPATAGSGQYIELPAALSRSLLPIYEVGKTAVFKKGDAGQKKGVVHAVIVLGEHGEGDLDTCLKFCNALRDKKLVDDKRTYLLTSQETTNEIVTKTLTKVLSNAAAEDTILFYYKGAAEGALDNADFRSLINSNTANGQAIITIFDADDIDVETWQGEYTRKLILLSASDTGLGFNNVTKFTEELRGLLYNSPQRVTYKEIISHWLISTKRLPGIIIQAEHLDDYFLSDIKKDEVVQKQELLKALGFNVAVDGQTNKQYRQALQEFKNRFALTSPDDILKELRYAVMLKEEDAVKVVYLTGFEDVRPGRRFPQNIVKKLAERIKERGRITIRQLDLMRLEEDGFLETVFKGHLILIGLNMKWLADAGIVRLVRRMLNITPVLNKKVQFILESECDWAEIDLSRYTIYPSSLMPVEEEQGLQDMLQELEPAILHLQRYLKVRPNIREIDRRIRTARETQRLNLSGLSLQEIPPEVFQLEGLLELNVKGNKITGIPPEIGQLHNLCILNLADNPIEILPAEIGDLYYLEELNLRGTDLIDLPFSIGEHSRLQTLYIDQTNIRVLNVGAFGANIPENITYGYPGLLNLPPSGSGINYFSPVHTKEFAIIEIHSVYARPVYNTVPRELKHLVHYGVHTRVETLHQLFKIIFTESGREHTIVYLNDEENVLCPQFGDQPERDHLIMMYFQAFGKPLNIIINNPGFSSNAYAALVVTGGVNFVAVRDNNARFNFADLFFENIWDAADATKLKFVYLAFSSAGLQKEEKLLTRSLTTAHFETLKPAGLAPMSAEYIEQINDQIPFSNIVILLVANPSKDRASLREINKRFIEQHYGAAIRNKKKVLVFLQNDDTGQIDPYIKKLLDRYFALQFVTSFSTAEELVIKVHLALSSIQTSKKRISLYELLIKLENLPGSGYRLWADYDNFRDFSFPFIKTDPIAKEPALKQLPDKAIPSGRPEREIALSPFNGKWVLVVGTGSKSKTKRAERFCARAVGKMLATEGYGLVCGGWSGVDYEVCSAFESVYKLHKRSVATTLLQVLAPYQQRSSKGKGVKVESADWNKYVLQRVMAVVIIGGSTLTSATYVEAMVNSVPVIPIPGTGNIAEMVYNSLLASGKYKQPYSRQLLQGLQGMAETKPQAEEIAQSVLDVLQELSAAATSGSKTKPATKKKSKKGPKKK